MKMSESITKIAPALLRAQKNIGAATKGAKNPFFKSSYADLGSVMETCKDALNDEGISVFQPVSSNGEQHYVETLLLHESGEYFSETMRLELKSSNMQEFGSSISYARRYGLQSMLFIPAEDDDGEKTMARNTKAAKEVAKTQAPVATVAPATPAAPKTDTPVKNSFRNTPSSAPAPTGQKGNGLGWS